MANPAGQSELGFFDQIHAPLEEQFEYSAWKLSCPPSKPCDADAASQGCFVFPPPTCDGIRDSAIAPAAGTLAAMSPTHPGEWIDVSVPLHAGTVCWPGDPTLILSPAASMAAGDLCNVSRLELSAHAGTHMDAPRHYLADGATIDSLPLEAVVGPARVVRIDDPHVITAAAVEALQLQTGERVLFRTRNSDRDWHSHPFDRDFVHLSADAARMLAACRVQTVGIDYLSVGGFERDGDETHRALLSAGIWLIEGLDLSRVTPGEYDLVCLPLRLVGADGAPARAILRPRGEA